MRTPPQDMELIAEAGSCSRTLHRRQTAVQNGNRWVPLVWRLGPGHHDRFARPPLIHKPPQTAKEILLQFLKYIHGGMLPNRFPDQGETPEYNTVDATLWFVEAIWQHAELSRRSGVEDRGSRTNPGAVLPGIEEHHQPSPVRGPLRDSRGQ